MSSLRYLRKLAGIEEREATTWSRLPEWGSGNERPLEAETAAWKLAVTKTAPKPEKEHLYDAETGQNSAYQSLSQALDALKLPTSDGKDRKVDPKEFVYRGQHTGDDGKVSWAHFKHRDTRNNVHLDLKGQTLVVPTNRSPFQRGQFDKVEHADVYLRLRLLAGIENS